MFNGYKSTISMAIFKSYVSHYQRVASTTHQLHGTLARQVGRIVAVQRWGISPPLNGGLQSPGFSSSTLW